MKKLLSLIVASVVMCAALFTGCGTAASDPYGHECQKRQKRGA